MTPNADELRRRLRGAYLRAPYAYVSIGGVSGLGEEKVRDIAEGNVEPDIQELYTLWTLSEGV